MTNRIGAVAETLVALTAMGCAPTAAQAAISRAQQSATCPATGAALQVL